MIEWIIFFLSLVLMNPFVWVIIFLVVLSKIIWHPKFPIWGRVTLLTGIVIFVVFFSGVSVFIRPYFTNPACEKINGERYCFGGTGVFINSNNVITNDHVVKGCATKINIRFENKLFGEAKLVLMDDVEDIAILSTEIKSKYFALFRKDPIKVGEKIIAPEYTKKNGFFKIRKGKVTSLDGDLFLTSGPGRQGNSGSPVYDTKGHLVGTQHGGGNDIWKKNVAFNTNSNYIINWLHKNKIPAYQVSKKNIDLTKSERFKQSFAVSILCSD
jgi:hypothetical protein